MDLFPQQSSFSMHSTEQDQLSNGENKNMIRESERAQVTMIYDGKVFVFNDVSSEKAEQILLLANHDYDDTSPDIYTKLNSRQAPTMPCNNYYQMMFPSFVENTNKNSNFEVSMDNMTCALPIARRNSLHRFLEKRVDRCGGRGPYHNYSSGRFVAVSQPQVESKWWPGLAPQPQP